MTVAIGNNPAQAYPHRSTVIFLLDRLELCQEGCTQLKKWR